MPDLKENLQTILHEKQQKIIPENIKSGTTIFDTVGTYISDITETSEYSECVELSESILNGIPTYTELEYLQSDRTKGQHIITDYFIKPNTRIVISYQPIQIINDDWIGQTLFGSVDNSFSFYVSGLSGDERKAGQTSPNYTEVFTNVDFSRVSLTWTRNNCAYNGSEVSGSFGKDNASLQFFRNGEFPGDMGNIKLYYCQIYEGDTLVKNFRPVRNTSGVVCLYDTISQKFYYNSGSGDFVGGGVI